MLTKRKYVDSVQFMRSDKEIFIDWLRHQMGVKRIMKGCDLANKAGVHPGTISGYLTGKSKGPRTKEECENICEAMGADYEKVIAEGGITK